jgi:hypothetical protein
MPLTFAVRADCASAGFFGGLAFARGPQFHPGPASFRQTNGYGLFSRARAMFAFTDVVHLFAHEFTGLSRWRFALALVAPGPLDSFSFGHKSLRQPAR